MNWKAAIILLGVLLPITVMANGYEPFRLGNPPGGPVTPYADTSSHFYTFNSTAQNFRYYHSWYDTNSYDDDVDRAFDTWGDVGPVTFNYDEEGDEGVRLATNPITWEPGCDIGDYDLDYNPTTRIINFSDSWIYLNLDDEYPDIIQWGTTQYLPTLEFDVESAVLHEIGHVIGLDHPHLSILENDEDDPIMFGGQTEYAYTNTMRWLRPEDEEGFTFLQLLQPVGVLYNDLDVALNAATDIEHIWDITLQSATHTINSATTIGDSLTLVVDGSDVVNVSATLTVADMGELQINGGTMTIQSGGKLVLYEDVEVSGGSLVFASGSELDLNGQTISTTGSGIIQWYGTQASEGTSGEIIFWDSSEMTLYGGYSTVQSALSSASSGDAIHVGAGYFSGSDITMKSNVDIIGIGYGFSPSSNTLLSFAVTFDDDITSTTRLYNLRVMEDILFDEASDAAMLESVWVGAHGGPEIEISTADPTIVDTYVWWGTTGIYAHSGYNWVYIDGGEIEQFDTGILTTSTGYIYIEDLYFCDQDDYDIENTYTGPYMGGVECYDCVWSDDPNYWTYGSVYWYPETGWDECGMKRSIASDQSRPINVRDHDEEMAEIAGALTIYRDVRRRIVADRKAGLEPDLQNYTSDITEFIDLFQTVVAENPNHPSAALAMGGVVMGYRLLQQETKAAKYLQGVLANACNASMKPYAQNLMVSHYRRMGDSEAALAMADSILASPIDDYLAGEILYAKGLIYERDLGDSTKAADMYLAMVLMYPVHSTTSLAIKRLEKMGKEVPVPAPAPAARKEEPEVMEVSLSGYPNPFNPTTTVRFGLPEAGSVTLIVYDLMGREVIRLADGYREAGWQSVIWDGRDAAGREVPTGMYLARLVTPQGVKAIKLVMMK